MECSVQKSASRIILDTSRREYDADMSMCCKNLNYLYLAHYAVIIVKPCSNLIQFSFHFIFFNFLNSEERMKLNENDNKKRS